MSAALVGRRDVFLGESLAKTSDTELELARNCCSGKYLDGDNNPIRPPTPRSWDSLELKDYVPWQEDAILAGSADPLEKERWNCVKAIDEQSRKLFNEYSAETKLVGSSLEILKEPVPMSPQYRADTEKQPSVSEVASESAGKTWLSERRVDGSEATSEATFSSEHQGGAKIKIRIQKSKRKGESCSAEAASEQCVEEEKMRKAERKQREDKRVLEQQLMQQQQVELKQIARARQQEIEKKRQEERKGVDEDSLEQQQQQNDILQAIIKHLEEMEQEPIVVVDGKELDQRENVAQAPIDEESSQSEAPHQSEAYPDAMFHRNSQMHKVKYAAKRQSIAEKDDTTEKNPNELAPTDGSSSPDYVPVIPTGKRRVAHRSTQHILTCRSVLGITKPGHSNNPSSSSKTKSSSSQKSASSSKSSSKPKSTQQPKNKLNASSSSQAPLPRVKSTSVDDSVDSRASSFDKSPVYELLRRENRGSSESLDSNANYKVKNPLASDRWSPINEESLQVRSSFSPPVPYIEAHRYLIPSSHVHGSKLMLPNFGFFEHLNPRLSTTSESSLDSTTSSVNCETKKGREDDDTRDKRAISEVDAENSLSSIARKKRKTSDCSAEDKKKSKKSNKKERIKSLFYY